MQADAMAKRSSRTRRHAPKRSSGASGTAKGPLRLYGLHAVRNAVANPRRRAHRLFATESAFQRLGIEPDCPLELVETAVLDRLVGRDAVHQGVVLECNPLERIDGSELFRLADARLVLVLDQVTDPHNFGAVLRSAVAMAADFVVTTHRNAAPETGVLAKSASGALDLVEVAEVRNLSGALQTLSDYGFASFGLDSGGPDDITAAFQALSPERIAIVLGAEGRGLREGTRAACDALVRLDMPGPIKSLNVSNAAVLALYLARAALATQSSKPR